MKENWKLSFGGYCVCLLFLSVFFVFSTLTLEVWLAVVSALTLIAIGEIGKPFALLYAKLSRVWDSLSWLLLLVRVKVKKVSLGKIFAVIVAALVGGYVLYNFGALLRKYSQLTSNFFFLLLSVIAVLVLIWGWMHWKEKQDKKVRYLLDPQQEGTDWSKIFKMALTVIVGVILISLLWWSVLPVATILLLFVCWVVLISILWMASWLWFLAALITALLLTKCSGIESDGMAPKAASRAPASSASAPLITGPGTLRDVIQSTPELGLGVTQAGVVAKISPGDGCISITKKYGLPYTLQRCMDEADAHNCPLVWQDGVIMAPLVMPDDTWTLSYKDGKPSRWEFTCKFDPDK